VLSNINSQLTDITAIPLVKMRSVQGHSKVTVDDRPINSQLTEEEIEQLIKDADSDHDGLISYEGKYRCLQVYSIMCL